MTEQSAHRLLACAMLAVLASTPCVAAETRPWVPVDCNERPGDLAELRARSGAEASAWEKFSQRVRAAEPGDSVFTPHPYPDSEKQVVEDFLYAYFEILHRDRSKVEPAELPIYDALKAGALTLEVLRVENWRSTRCHPRRPSPYFHLVRLLDDTRKQVATGVLHSTGLFSRYGRLSDQATGLEDLDAITDTLKQQFGLEMSVAEPQYVATDGLPLPCLPEVPCVAFRSRENIYLLTRGPLLYEISSTQQRRPLLDHLERLDQKGRELGLGGKEYERPLVTMGMVGTTARRIGGEVPQTPAGR